MVGTPEKAYYIDVYTGIVFLSVIFLSIIISSLAEYDATRPTFGVLQSLEINK